MCNSKIRNFMLHISRSRSKDRGFTLIAVMWIVTILTVLASEFIYSMQLEIRIARNWSDQVSAFYAAKGGLETAIAGFRNDQTGQDSLDEDWAQQVQGELNGCNYTTIAIDESARINVNTTDEETLRKALAYVMKSSGEEKPDEQVDSEAQTLATAVIEKRPYRTVADMSKAIGMTAEILYGQTPGVSADETETSSADTSNNGDEEQQQQRVALVDIITTYSLDKNVDNEGNRRVNINSADANQIRQGLNSQDNEVITQQEAQAIIDYRGQQSSGQSNQGGQAGQAGQAGQTGQAGQAGQAGQTQSGLTGISQLLDVPAISQQTLDSIRNRIVVQDSSSGNSGQNRVNINTADSNALQGLSNRIDSGIANSIIAYRENNQFDNVDELREVKVLSTDEFKEIVDKATISDDQVLQGKVNINTAPLEILQMLPGMDETKAQAIVTHRTVENGQALTAVTSQQGEQESGTFTSIGQLLDVEGIDEQTFRQIVDQITYRSSTFRIESEGKTADGKVIQNCVAVIDRSGTRVKIRYWKQE